MTFRITGRIRKPKGVTVTEARRIIGPSREMCAACGWFQSEVDRCCHPYNGCPRGAHRIRPWEHPRECPVSVLGKSATVPPHFGILGGDATQ